MSKAQKEKILRLNPKDKKLTRLLYLQGLSAEDSLTLNYCYEQKQNLNFKYAIVGVGAFTVATNYLFFRSASSLVKYGYLACAGFALHVMVSKIIEKRAHQLMDPYFEKYQIK